MKRICFILMVLAFNLPAVSGFAQNVAINEDGAMANPNAILDVKSGNKGVLIPRMSTAGRLAIPTTKGLLVYDTTVGSFFFNNGSAWQNMLPPAVTGTGWSLTGNSGTTSNNFLGTSDHTPLTVRVNNLLAGRIEPDSTYNTFWGYSAGNSNLAGMPPYNTGIGAFALQANQSGQANTATGTSALQSNTSGGANTANGVNTLHNNTTGGFNTATGHSALYSNTTAANNTADGYNALALNTTGYTNTATGSNALKSNSTGYENSAFGSNALQSNTTGNDNTALGLNSLGNNTTGRVNTAGGSGALNFNTTGNVNTAFGGFALSGNTFGEANTAVGYQSLVFNIGGSTNTGIGYAAGFSNEGGSGNTAVGNQALYSPVSGNLNTAIGNLAGYHSSGSNNTSLGAGADCFGSNSTAIGYNAFANTSNKVRIGNTAVTVIEGQVPFTTPSDGRFKYQVKENVKGLDFILQLRPVTYQFDTKRFETFQRHEMAAANAGSDVTQAAYDEASAIRRSGFIAQEVEKAATVSGYDFSGIIRPKTDQDHYSLSYESFVVPLVKAVQELKAIITTQEKQIAAQQQQIDELKKIVSKTP